MDIEFIKRVDRIAEELLEDDNLDEFIKELVNNELSNEERIIEYESLKYHAFQKAADLLPKPL